VTLIVFIVVLLPVNSAISFAETQSTGSTAVILVRHGETDWNELDILQGRANTTLNKNNIERLLQWI